MAAGWMNGGIPRMAMFRFMPGGGGTRGNGRGGRRPMLRVLESAIASIILFPSLLSVTFLTSEFSHCSGFFVCGPHGSAADLQLELLEILTPGLGRAARR